MLIKFWIGIIIAIGLTILTIVMFAKIFAMMKKQPVAGGTIGFFVGIVFFILYFIVPGRVYVVTGDAEYNHYVAIGSPEYEMSNGQKFTVDFPSGYCFVINDTENRIMIEEVIYGGFGFSPSPLEISGMSADIVETHAIDHFFDDVPPDEISVSEGADQVSRFWLRRARD
jgi:hypothetical protein